MGILNKAYKQITNLIGRYCKTTPDAVGAAMSLDKKVAMSAIENMLQKHGFKKKKGMHIKSLTENAIAWLGLNRASFKNYLAINMVVGLRFQDVEKAMYEYLGETDNGVFPPTFASNIGYTYGAHYYEVVFQSDDEISARVADMENALVQFGIPFFEQHTSLESIEPVLRTNKYGIPEYNAYRLPIVLNMLDKKQDAADCVNAWLEEISPRTDEAAERYRLFAHNF
ncbi:MAG: hypothetical protein Ta2A_08570 [Treponemataceae bacterium]|nr:MAG: hypothetical protein Ta2A_08570 [Treponemataceae bacterium]